MPKEEMQKIVETDSSSKDETVYIVSGHMRTGTSMMMQALEAGGLEAIKSKKRDKLIDIHKDEHYAPNPSLYELERKEYTKIDFPPDSYKGKLIKMMWHYLPTLIAGNYKIVFMMRDPEEIRQSYMAFFNVPTISSLKGFEERMKIAIDRLKVRKDTEVIIFQYREVIKNPAKHFQILKDNGWPIDVNKSTSVIDPKLCRYKLEELEIGVV